MVLRKVCALQRPQSITGRISQSVERQQEPVRRLTGTFSPGDYLTLFASIMLLVSFLFLTWFTFPDAELTGLEALNVTRQALIYMLFAGFVGTLAGVLGVLFPGGRVNTSVLAFIGSGLAFWYIFVLFTQTGNFFLGARQFEIDYRRLFSAEDLETLVATDHLGIGFWVGVLAAIALAIQILIPRPGIDNPSVPQNIARFLGKVWANMRCNPTLYIMILPGLLYFAVFQYGPMYGATVAFKEYRILDGILGSPWVGFRHFETVFSSYYFENILTNTLIISSFKIVFGVPVAVTLAILMNEVRTQWFKRSVQTITYLPHFLSWVVVSGILLAVLSPADGLVNNAIKDVGGTPINFLAESDWFRQVLIGSDMWKSAGFEAIIYLAAMAGISPQLYEAAAVDGASRFQRIWHITLPGILPVVVLVMLLNIGYILSAGFEQVFVLYTIPVYDVGDIIDTWVYRRGLEQFQISVASAVGLFKGVVGMVLIITTNWIARRTTGSGIW